jgi:acyl carrier protein
MNQVNYTAEEIRQKVYSVVFEVSGIETSKLNASLLINDDIAPVSLDRVSLFMALEDEFSTTVEEEELQDIETLGDLVSFVERKAKSAST